MSFRCSRNATSVLQDKRVIRITIACTFSEMSGYSELISHHTRMSGVMRSSHGNIQIHPILQQKGTISLAFPSSLFCPFSEKNNTCLLVGKVTFTIKTINPSLCMSSGLFLFLHIVKVHLLISDRCVQIAVNLEAQVSTELRGDLSEYNSAHIQASLPSRR